AAFIPDGKLLLTGSHDTTVLIWDATRIPKPAPPRPVDLQPAELEALWTDLGAGDAARADAALRKLAAARQAVAFLGERLRPVTEADVRRIPDRIADLDSDDFAVRENATTELERLGELAAPALRRAMEGNPPAEVRRRAEALLEKAQEPASSVGWLRAL